MTPNQQREEISKAYVAAVAARCKFKLGAWSQDDDCLDVTIGAAGVLGGGTLAGPKLDIQLKSTSVQTHVNDQHVVWSLRRSHYDSLRADSCNPRILVVLILPESESTWIEHTAESLILRRCAYWHTLRGCGPIAGEASSTTVRLPLTNVFSPQTLKRLMEKISRGETL